MLMVLVVVLCAVPVFAQVELLQCAPKSAVSEPENNGIVIARNPALAEKEIGKLDDALRQASFTSKVGVSSAFEAIEDVKKQREDFMKTQDVDNILSHIDSVDVNGDKSVATTTVIYLLKFCK